MYKTRCEQIIHTTGHYVYDKMLFVGFLPVLVYNLQLLESNVMKHTHWATVIFK